MRISFTVFVLGFCLPLWAGASAATSTDGVDPKVAKTEQALAAGREENDARAKAAKTREQAKNEKDAKKKNELNTKADIYDAEANNAQERQLGFAKEAADLSAGGSPAQSAGKFSTNDGSAELKVANPSSYGSAVKAGNGGLSEEQMAQQYSQISSGGNTYYYDGVENGAHTWTTLDGKNSLSYTDIGGSGDSTPGTFQPAGVLSSNDMASQVNGSPYTFNTQSAALTAYQTQFGKSSTPTVNTTPAGLFIVLPTSGTPAANSK